MIHVYDIGNTDYDGLGDAIIQPLSGKVKQVAGGNYDLSMECAMDPEGKWKHLVPGAIVKASVPKEIIENAYSGLEADVYKTNTEAALREEANEPTVISYPTWPNTTAGENPGVGMKTSYENKNYICNYWDPSSRGAGYPPSQVEWWSEIARYTQGSPALVTLPTGAELYFVEDYNTSWYKMSTFYGLVGYIKKSYVTYDRHLTPSETKPRVITEQLFRITEPTIDNESQRISVNGIHVSYDLAGILIQDVSIGQASPAMAIGLMMQAMMIPYDGVIATNLTTDTNGTYTGKINGKNAIYALLDPDAGIVSTFHAKFTRDNWDVFLMQRVTVDRGFRILYGKNARGINWQKNSANLVNRVVPVAKDEKGNDLYLPEKWIDSPLISQYPVIRMERLAVKGQVGKDKGDGDGSTWTLSALLDEMRAKAGERFSVDHADAVTHEVTVQVEMLGDTAEYAWMRGLENVLLYDTVTASDEEIGLEMQLLVTELEWDIVRKKISGLKLSNVNDLAKRTVTGYNVQNNSISGEKLMDGVAREIVQQAVDIMPEFSDPQASRPATIPPASDTVLGGIRTGFVSAPANGFYAVTTYYENALVAINEAAAADYGVVKTGYTDNNKNYGVQLSDSGQMFVNVPWANRNTWFGTSDTASATQDKIATVSSDFALETGVMVTVLFSTSQGYNGQPTLNVNSTGAKPITIYGTTAAQRYEWRAGSPVSFVYDGTSWVIVDAAHATTSYFGKTKLNDTLTSTSTGQALTANQGKVLNDKLALQFPYEKDVASDLNALTTEGWWRTNANTLNLPDNKTGFCAVMLRTSTSTIYQRFFAVDGYEYYRYTSNGSFSGVSWIPIKINAFTEQTISQGNVEAAVYNAYLNANNMIELIGYGVYNNFNVSLILCIPKQAVSSTKTYFQIGDNYNNSVQFHLQIAISSSGAWDCGFYAGASLISNLSYKVLYW